VCGIAGIIDFDGPDPVQLGSMLEALVPRGPDDAGTYRDETACLGHRRLAIIDLTPTGREPLANEDGRLQLVFNGELYEYRAVRRELERRGHRFSSTTDAEVVLHLYEEYGDELVEHIDGMFAFALWDRDRRRLLLARDRMGKKPLYYRVAGRRLVFGSELKALFALAETPRTVDPAAMHAYLLLGYVPGALSIIRGVSRLTPGTTAVFAPDCELRTRRFYTPRIEVAAGAPCDPVEACAELSHLLGEAVRRRLLAADVEVGVLLSGGVDSSLITALAAGERERIKAFSIGFSDAAFDETAHACRVAAATGVEHICETVTPAVLLEVLPRVLSVFDEPFADASAVPTYVLARMTAEHVKVVLGGDGADELFGGYPTLRAQRWATILARLPGSGPLLRATAHCLPDGTGYYPFGYVLRRFAAGFEQSPAPRQLAWTSYLSPELLTRVGPGFSAWPVALTELFEELAGLAPETASHLLDQRLYLADDILVKGDRASMGCSLEVRTPFLDHRVVQFANGLPPALTREKTLLRRLLRHTAVPFAADRKKQGFAVPVGEWLRGEMRDWAAGLLPRAADLGLATDVIQDLWAEHLAGRRNRWRELWAVLVLCEWSARWKASV